MSYTKNILLINNYFIVPFNDDYADVIDKLVDVLKQYPSDEEKNKLLSNLKKYYLTFGESKFEDCVSLLHKNSQLVEYFIKKYDLISDNIGFFNPIIYPHLSFSNKLDIIKKNIDVSFYEKPLDIDKFRVLVLYYHEIVNNNYFKELYFDNSASYEELLFALNSNGMFSKEFYRNLFNKIPKGYRGYLVTIASSNEKEQFYITEKSFENFVTNLVQYCHKFKTYEHNYQPLKKIDHMLLFNMELNELQLSKLIKISLKFNIDLISYAYQYYFLKATYNNDGQFDKNKLLGYYNKFCDFLIDINNDYEPDDEFSEIFGQYLAEFYNEPNVKTFDEFYDKD